MIERLWGMLRTPKFY